MTKKKGYKPPPDSSGMPEAGYGPPPPPPPKVEPTKPWPSPPDTSGLPVDVPIPTVDQLEQYAFDCLNRQLMRPRDLMLQGIGYSLLALLRFLRETE